MLSYNCESGNLLRNVFCIPGVEFIIFINSSAWIPLSLCKQHKDFVDKYTKSKIQLALDEPRFIMFILHYSDFDVTHTWLKCWLNMYCSSCSELNPIAWNITTVGKDCAAGISSIYFANNKYSNRPDSHLCCIYGENILLKLATKSTIMLTRLHCRCSRCYETW